MATRYLIDTNIWIDALGGVTDALAGVVTGRTILTRNLADFFAYRQAKVEIPYHGRWLEEMNVSGEKTKVWVSTI